MNFRYTPYGNGMASLEDLDQNVEMFGKEEDMKEEIKISNERKFGNKNGIKFEGHTKSMNHFSSGNLNKVTNH